MKVGGGSSQNVDDATRAKGDVDPVDHADACFLLGMFGAGDISQAGSIEACGRDLFGRCLPGLRIHFMPRVRHLEILLLQITGISQVRPFRMRWSTGDRVTLAYWRPLQPVFTQF